jgi:hypothetical protein
VEVAPGEVSNVNSARAGRVFSALDRTVDELRYAYAPTLQKPKAVFQ